MAVGRARLFESMEQLVEQRTLALAQSEALLRKILDNLPVGVLVADRSGRLMMSNPESSLIWGRALPSELADRGQYQGCWAETGEPVQADGSLASLLGFDKGTVVYRPVGCDACNHTGFAGRIGVFEAVRVDETIRRLINDNGDEAIIARHAFLNAPNLGSAARELVRTGQTTAEEAIRISRREAEPPAVAPETIDG